MKKLLTVLLTLLLAFSVFAGGQQEAGQAEAAEVKNPDTFIYASHGTLESLDPAKAYDNASGGIIQNIYETLVAFDGSATDKFVPVLCEEVPTVGNGLITNGGKTYKFKIRKGIKFHSGNDLTPEVVKTALQRYMVTDPDGGPCWMFFMPTLGLGGSRDGDGNIAVQFSDIENAIQVDGDYVVLNLRAPFPPMLATLAGYWASIVDMEFVKENGGWDGKADGWEAYNGPEAGSEILFDIASGTGPYKLDRWDAGTELVLVENENYWGEKPVMKKAIYKVIDEWGTRKLMLLQGDVDCVEVDPMYYEEMDQEAGLTVYRDMQELGVRCVNFNQGISGTDNPYIYSGKLDGQGINPEFFQDKNVRLAFCHAWDQATFIDQVMDNNAVETATPHVVGLPFRTDNLERHAYDLEKAAEYMKKAWDGQVWEKGFKVDMLFNKGNETREAGLRMLAEGLMSINPKFEVNVRELDWATYLEAQRTRAMPTFFIGWGADYPHPDNFMYVYMHTDGYYANRCSYSNPEADALLEAGAIELDDAKAAKIYARVQEIWLEDAVGIAMYQPVKRHYFKDWVKGYYFHPMENEFNYSMFSKEN